MTPYIVAVAWTLACGLVGYLIGRRIRARVLDQHITTAATLARAGVIDDTPLHRAQTVHMPDRSNWGQQ
jgi:hypothetical protein